jgi:prepilin-type N-terminal cleavage/methylation domain-containing protein
VFVEVKMHCLYKHVIDLPTHITAKTQSGFTLLEMVLVLFLISLMASATLFITDNLDDQASYDETKRRMEIIRQAIVGDPTRRLNGQTEIRGFAADMGRLPGCLRELVESNHCIDASGALAAWTIDASTGLGSGWRGPYIQVTPESDGALRFRDGYLNTATDASGAIGTNSDAAVNGDDERNHGWTWAIYDSADNLTSDVFTAENIRIQSFGTDGSNKYPRGNLNSTSKLIDANDFRASLANWDSFSISFSNVSSGIVSIPANSLRIKLSYVDNGIINDWPDNVTERDNSDYLSATFPSSDIYISNGSIDVLNGNSVNIPSGSTLNGNEIIIGTNGLVDFTATSEQVSVKANDILIVPTGSTLSGTTLTIFTNGKIFFPTYYINTGLQFPDLISPVIGQYSLIIACDDTVNENAVSGQRFDGDCNRYGTDLSPINYSALTQPYLFQIPPRSVQISPPTNFSWTIQ